jgi:hypothetical protein
MCNTCGFSKAKVVTWTRLIITFVRALTFSFTNLLHICALTCPLIGINVFGYLTYGTDCVASAPPGSFLSSRIREVVAWIRKVGNTEPRFLCALCTNPETLKERVALLSALATNHSFRLSLAPEPQNLVLTADQITAESNVNRWKLEGIYSLTKILSYFVVEDIEMKTLRGVVHIILKKTFLYFDRISNLELVWALS